MREKTLAIIQARMASIRLPGKVLMQIQGKPILWYLVERLKRARMISEMIIATSSEVTDEPIVAFCQYNNLKVFRGSESDVLSRYAEAASLFDSQIIIRICADSPLLDPVIIDDFVIEFLSSNKKYDYLSNTINQTYPLGMNVEIFTKTALEEANVLAKYKYEREHVTPYIYNNPLRYRICQKHLQEDFSKIRLTVDVVEDFNLIKLLIEHFHSQITNLGLDEILSFYVSCPDVFKINSHIKQKMLKSD